MIFLKRLNKVLHLVSLLFFRMVPRARFELATQGFSVLCSTPDGPRQIIFLNLTCVLYTKKILCKFFLYFLYFFYLTAAFHLLQHGAGLLPAYTGWFASLWSYVEKAWRFGRRFAVVAEGWHFARHRRAARQCHYSVALVTNG